MSAPLSNHVSMTISTDSVGISRAGYGVTLLPSYKAAWTERSRVYGGVGDVLVDFPSLTGPEYLFAIKYFGQTPSPEKLIIGRCALKPTKVLTLVPAAINSHVYSLRLGGDGVTETVVTYTSDGSATASEIVAGLITAANAVVGKNFTATGSTTLVLTGNAAGNWFFCESVAVGDMSINETQVDAGIVTDLQAIQLETDEWYTLETSMNSDATVKAAAAWIETQAKLYTPVICGTDDILNASDGTTGTGDDLMTLAYTRTMVSYHHKLDQFFAGAWNGRVNPLDPGTVVYHDKELAGITPPSLTATQRTNLTARHMNSYEAVTGTGRSVTFDGKACDGEFLDVRRDLDALKDDMTKEVFGIIIGSDKIPFDDAGIARIEAGVRASLTRFENNGVLVPGSSVITVPRASSVSTSDKNLRILNGVKFSAVIAGAIHKVNLVGVVSK